MTARTEAAIAALERGDLVEALRQAWDDGRMAGARSRDTADFRNPFRDLEAEAAESPQSTDREDGR